MVISRIETVPWLSNEGVCVTIHKDVSVASLYLCRTRRKITVSITSTFFFFLTNVLQRRKCIMCSQLSNDYATKTNKRLFWKLHDALPRFMLHAKNKFLSSVVNLLPYFNTTLTGISWANFACSRRRQCVVSEWQPLLEIILFIEWWIQTYC